MSLLVDLAQKILENHNSFHKEGIQQNQKEGTKVISRTDIINHLLGERENPYYLEIGVRNPEDNFNHIESKNKYSVDPGVEFGSNPVDFKMTSDIFFERIKSKEILKDVRFDVIFIDGLHLAEQVERDINNSLNLIKEDGFIVMHDCNPPSEWHARETYEYKLSPAKGCWNGTTWKAFVRARAKKDIFSCCIDTDWGVGIISKKIKLGIPTNIENPFWEFDIFERNRTAMLNLVSFEEFKEKLRVA